MTRRPVVSRCVQNGLTTIYSSPPLPLRLSLTIYSSLPLPRRLSLTIYSSPPLPRRLSLTTYFLPPLPRRLSLTTNSSPPLPRRLSLTTYSSPPLPRRLSLTIYSSPPLPRRIPVTALELVRTRGLCVCAHMRVWILWSTDPPRSSPKRAQGLANPNRRLRPRLGHIPAQPQDPRLVLAGPNPGPAGSGLPTQTAPPARSAARPCRPRRVSASPAARTSGQPTLFLGPPGRHGGPSALQPALFLGPRPRTAARVPRGPARKPRR